MESVKSVKSLCVIFCWCLVIYLCLCVKSGKTFEKMEQDQNKVDVKCSPNRLQTEGKGKCRSLERKYKKSKLSKTGRNRKTCPYESELNKVLGERRGPMPEFVLSSDTVVDISEEQLMHNSSDENISSTSDDSYSPALKRRKHTESFTDRLFKRIDEMEKKNQEYRSNILKRLDEREAIDRERNKKLKAILDKLSQ